MSTYQGANIAPDVVSKPYGHIIQKEWGIGTFLDAHSDNPHVGRPPHSHVHAHMTLTHSHTHTHTHTHAHTHTTLPHTRMRALRQP